MPKTAEILIAEASDKAKFTPGWKTWAQLPMFRAMVSADLKLMPRMPLARRHHLLSSSKMLMAHPADLNIMNAGELFRNDKKYISAKQVSADPLCPQVAVQAWRGRGKMSKNRLCSGPLLRVSHAVHACSSSSFKLPRNSSS